MARNIHSRIRIEGQLRVLRSLHVGGLHDDAPNVDLSLAVNGQGQVYVPGTSLAGALRSYMEQMCNPSAPYQPDKTETDSVWGYQKKDEGHASFMVVEDAVVHLPSGAAMDSKAIKPDAMEPKDMEIRDGVGIDRHSGTAAKNFKAQYGIQGARKGESPIGCQVKPCLAFGHCG